jgi:hypothetical protein
VITLEEYLLDILIENQYEFIDMIKPGLEITDGKVIGSRYKAFIESFDYIFLNFFFLVVLGGIYKSFYNVSSIYLNSPPPLLSFIPHSHSRKSFNRYQF